MATTTLVSLKVACKLDNGTSADGAQKYVSISFPTLSKNNFDGDKAIAIVSALEPCLSKAVVEIDQTEVSTISAA